MKHSKRVKSGKTIAAGRRGVLILVLWGASFLGAPAAFAVDQVRLKDGQILEGTVLNDIPNRYLDLRLVSGQTRRIPRADVDSVERDLPSASADRAILGNEARAWAGALLGGCSNLSAVGSSMNFNFGLRFGWHATKMEFGWLSLGIGYDYVSSSNQVNTLFVNPLLVPSHDLHLEALLTRVGQTGFYFGPSAGFATFQSPAATGFGGNTLQSSLAFGGLGGYFFALSKTLILGPEVRFEYVSDRQMSLLRYGLQLGTTF